MVRLPWTRLRRGRPHFEAACDAYDFRRVVRREGPCVEPVGVPRGVVAQHRRRVLGRVEADGEKRGLRSKPLPPLRLGGRKVLRRRRACGTPPGTYAASQSRSPLSVGPSVRATALLTLQGGRKLRGGREPTAGVSGVSSAGSPARKSRWPRRELDPRNSLPKIPPARWKSCIVCSQIREYVFILRRIGYCEDIP